MNGSTLTESSLSVLAAVAFCYLMATARVYSGHHFPCLVLDICCIRLQQGFESVHLFRCVEVDFTVMIPRS